jgi:hypothetical protein
MVAEKKYGKAITFSKVNGAYLWIELVKINLQLPR